ncbi:sugar phosphate nucleotidyltransferase [Agromyces sp. LHK192]|uniref:sugar phosphate nucleotidyltransferase n=1 Tax=Agromyces sp. LHK192 TaxID=2498704 RepID=UPI000FD9AF5C|nr:sugar phosphate nucleotidyltransferase [Agromyces sp. LHK192]
MIDAQLATSCVRPSASLLDAVQAIDRGASGIACITEESSDVLVGVLTDGDVRRALIGGAQVGSPALPHATLSPLTLPSGTPRAQVLDLMRAHRIDAIPIVSESGVLVEVQTLSDIVGGSHLPNHAVIMAGGRGTRLGSLTRSTPKPLMQVAGRPIIEWIILGLVGDGIQHVHVSVNYLADQIIDRLGSGGGLGCEIHYLREEPESPLGTAGSLTLLPEELTASSADPLIVLNGDLMVEFDARALLAHHEATRAGLTIGTKSYQHSVPFGVLELDDARKVTGIVEKPDLSVEINAAVYCVDAQLIGLLPPRAPSTMPELAQSALDRGIAVSAWGIEAEWIDVGTPGDLARAKGEV